MTARPFPPAPGGYERAYAESYGLAFDKLVQADLEEICRRSGAVPLDDDAVGLAFLNRKCRVDRRRREVVLQPDDQPLPTAEKLLVLHYLITARGTPPWGSLISFKELPEGIVYYPTFYQRAIAPLLGIYGRSPEKIVAAAARLGGSGGIRGDAEVTLRAFPHVALTWILWRGDEEFPADGTVLMDRGIQDYLPVEDIVVLCQRTAIRLSLAG